MLVIHEWLTMKLHQIEMASHFDKVRLQGGEPPGAVETEVKCPFCWEPNCYPEVVPTKTGKSLDTCCSKVSKANGRESPLVGTRGQESLCGHLGRTHIPTLD